MSLTIICDLDSTVVDLLTPWLDAYNRDYGDSLTTADIREWDISKIVKPACGRHIFDYLAEPGLFLRAQPFTGVIDALHAIAADGHRVYIASDCFYPINAKEKMEWCHKALPFIPRDQIILGAAKHLLCADVFIDDSPGQVERYRAAWGLKPIVLTLGFPYNECIESLADVYARDWRSPDAAWHMFSDAIRECDVTLPDGRRVPSVA